MNHGTEEAWEAGCRCDACRHERRRITRRNYDLAHPNRRHGLGASPGERREAFLDFSRIDPVTHGCLDSWDRGCRCFLCIHWQDAILESIS